jgi:hypothetical protein
MPEGDTSYILLIVISIYYRNRVRMFPAIVNCTTIDWYSEWPQDALLEVAEKYIQEVSLGSEKQVSFVRFSKDLPGIL